MLSIRTIYTIIVLYWENNAYMYWVKEQLCIKLLVAEAACAASAYLSSVLLLEQLKLLKLTLFLPEGL